MIQDNDDDLLASVPEVVVGGDGDADEYVADDGDGDERDQQHAHRHQLQVDPAAAHGEVHLRRSPCKEGQPNWFE